MLNWRYIKIQSVPHSKHCVSVMKTSQLMLYREIIAVCSLIHTKKHKYTVWAGCYTSVTYCHSHDQHTCTEHDIRHSRIQLRLQRSCMQNTSNFFSSSVRSEIDRLSVWGAPQGHHDIPQTREESDRTRESCRRAWTANKPSGQGRMLFRTPNCAVLQAELYSGPSTLDSNPDRPSRQRGCWSRPTLPEITIHTNTIISNLPRFGRSRDRVPVWVRFYAPVQTGTGAHPPVCTMGTGSLSRG